MLILGADICRLVRDSDAWAADETFLREVLLTAFERRRFQTEVINAMPLYPTEAVLWDENQVPSTHYTGGDYHVVSLLHAMVEVERETGPRHLLHRWGPRCFAAYVCQSVSWHDVACIIWAVTV